MKLPSLLLLNAVLMGTSSAFTVPVQKSTAIIRRSPTLALGAEKSYLDTLEKKEETTSAETTTTAVATTTNDDKKKDEDEEDKEPNMFDQVKQAGTAGAISLGLWEGAFWMVSIPVAAFGFHQVTGHWPDFQNQDDMTKLGAEAFAFVNFARFAVPLRIGLALATVPWVQENIVDSFMKGDEEEATTTTTNEEGEEIDESLEVVMDFSAEQQVNVDSEAATETVVEEEAGEETPQPKRRLLGRLVPGFLRRDKQE